MFSIIKKYFKEVIEECKKIVFPTKKDVYSTSVYIVIIIIIVALGISFTDFLIEYVIKLVIFGMEN